VAFNPDATLFAVVFRRWEVRVFEAGKIFLLIFILLQRFKKGIGCHARICTQGKDESKQDYKARQARAYVAKQEVYNRYYAKYLEILKQQDPAQENRVTTGD
jgi:hypothetical protein